jgi:hypothetical protein
LEIVLNTKVKKMTFTRSSKSRFIAITTIVVSILILVTNAATIRSSAKGNHISSTDRKLQVVFANEYTSTLDKTEYVFGEPIGLTQVSKTGVAGTPSRWDILILPEKDLQLVRNPTDFVLTAFSRLIQFNNGTVVKYLFKWGVLDNYYYSLVGNNLDYNPKELAAGTNVTIPNQTVLDTKLVVVTTERIFSSTSPGFTLKVVSVSNAFKFKLNNVNITLNKSIYKPGETIRLNFAKQSYPNPRIQTTYNLYEYMKYYKVLSSNTGTPLKFNNSTQAKYLYLGNVPETQTLDRQLITWTEPGKYQAVLFQGPEQIVLGTSSVFEVRKPSTIKNVSVVMDNTTYYPYQNMFFTIKADRELKGRVVTFSFAHANATDKDFSDSTKIIDTWTDTWQIANNEYIFSFFNTIVQPGSYKVGVTISIGPGPDYALFITKPFTVIQSRLSVTFDPPRKSFFQGESVTTIINNPDIFFFFVYRDYYSGHGIAAVNAGFPNKGPVVGPISIESFRSLNMYLPAGQYQFALFRLGNFFVDFEKDYILTLPNSNFTISPNIATVTTDKTQYKFDEQIIITVTTSRNVTLEIRPSPTHQLKLIQSNTPNITEDFSDKSNFDSSTSFTPIGNKLVGRRFVAFRTTGIFTIVVHYGLGPGQTTVWAESKRFTITT